MRTVSRSTRLASIVIAAVGLVAVAGFVARHYWKAQNPAGAGDAISEEGSAAPSGKVLLSDQAITNLGLTSKPARLQTYWKTIQVPGMVVDRPGLSDRSIVSPVTGVVIKVNHLPGETVQPGDVLFRVRLLSDALHQTQTDLFKAIQDIMLAEAQRDRLRDAGGAIPGARLIEVDNQITRLQLQVKSARQELANRGLTPEQIDRVMEGQFVTEIAVLVPGQISANRPESNFAIQPAGQFAEYPGPTFEVQELRAELGEQVQVGQTLCLLSNHQMLAVEGRAFRDETPLLERNVKENWPVEVDFQEEAAGDWPPLNQTFHIRHLANTIDPVNRTFAFLMPLTNESKVVRIGDRTQILWRFRPGQKARILVKVEKLDNVFVLPAEAVAREGAEAFVFTQNVNTFERKPVRLVMQDRQHAVIANDGSLLPGTFVVQNVAAQLDRMAKSQSSTAPKGYHVHADGSLHKNEEEVK